MAKKAPDPGAGKERGHDLTTILDEAQRAELTLLIANITESMRNLVVQNFDASAALDQNLFPQKEMTEEEKMMSADPASADVEKYERQKKMKQGYEKDLATPKMKTLKKNVLKAFDEWRQQVILRVGRVVDSEETAKKHLSKSNTSDSRPKAPTTIGVITDVPQNKVNLKFKDLFPPTKTALTKLSMDKRTLILHSVLLLLLSLEHYTAASRVLLLNLTSSLKLPLKTFEQDEYVTAKGLLEGVKELSATEETRKKAEENKEYRKRQVRLATVAGAAIIGVAGGLAAPLVASGIGSIATGLGLGTTAAAGYLGSVAGSTVIVGSLFGAYGGRMTGQMMDKYAREVEDFEFLPVHSNNRTSEDPDEGAQQASEHDHKLRVTICISGWLTEKEEVVKPWRIMGTGAEVFALKYELEALLNLGNAMNGMVQSAAWGYAQKELIERTIFAELMAAMWPMGLLKVARVLDNPFSVAIQRAEKAGEVLADALINRAQGERPVTLIAYSMGARVVYVCLQQLAKRKAFNLVENAVLIGAPTPSDTSDWRVLRSVVTGRLVNVFSKNDYILGFMYRTSAIQYGVAGLQAVEGLAGIENVDVSEDVDGHLRYRFLVGAILKKIGFEDVDMEAVNEEQEALKKMLEEEKKNSLQAQRRRLLRQKSYEGGKVDEDAEAEHEASEMEKTVKEKTQKSLVTRVIEWWYSPKVPNTVDAEKVAGNIQRALQDPSQVSGVASDTVKDIQSSTQSMAQRVYAALPNIPYMQRTSTGNVQKTASNPAKGTSTIVKKGDGQSYTQMASAYLPKSMPSMSMPSMPSMPAMPSMPNVSLPGRNNSAAKKQTQSMPAKATQAGYDTTKKAVGAVTDTAATTAKNTANLQNNPAVKQVRQAPIIHQAVDNDPGVTQTLGTVTGVVGTTVNNTVDTAVGTGKAVGSKAEAGAGKGAGAVAKGVAKAGEAGQGVLPSTNIGTNKNKPGTGKGTSNEKAQGKSYTSYAASYMPNIPSLPSWKRGKADQEKATPPKLERKNSSQVQTPKLQDKESTGVKSSAPSKLGLRKTSGLPGNESGVKSPAPLSRAQSGLKSPPVKPQTPQLPPGSIKSPSTAVGKAGEALKSPPVLQRLPSGVKSPSAAGDTLKRASNAPQQAVKKGGDVAGQVASGGQEAVKGGANAATATVGGVFGGAKKLTGFGK